MTRASWIVAVGIVVVFFAQHHVSAEALVRDEAKSAGEDSTAIETSFDELAFDPGEEFRRMFVPQRIDELDGKRVRIRGYMWPSSKQRGIRRFVLRKNFGCSYKHPADEVIRVTVEEGWGTEFTTRAITVEGRFVIDPVEGQERTIALYRLDDATVFTAAGEKFISP